MLNFNDRIKIIANKLCLWNYIKGKSNVEIYDFFCDYLFQDPNFNILEQNFENMNVLIDKTLGPEYSSLLQLVDRQEIYYLATEIAKEKFIG